jgi:hypothetical protein
MNRMPDTSFQRTLTRFGFALLASNRQVVGVLTLKRLDAITSA